MRIVRVRTIAGIDYMADKIMVDDLGTPIDQYINCLKQMITAGQDDIFILQVWDGDEIKAFLIALAPASCEHIWVAQTWISPSLADTKAADRLFLRLLMWSESLGRSEVRMETKRDESAFTKRWNFQTHSVIMSFKVDRDLDEKLIAGQRDVLTGKIGDSNERKQQSIDTVENGVQSDERTEECSKADRESVDGEYRPRSGDVSGEHGSTVIGTDAASSGDAQAV